MRWPVVIVTILLTLLASCSTYTPLIDTKLTEPLVLEADLKDCRAYAQGYDPYPDAAENSVGYAAGGATAGVALGAAFGAALLAPILGIVIGLAFGMASGTIGVEKEIIQKCMTGRGYSVLR